ncbi:MAG: hypothetical protein ACRYF4_12305 [Janthinobacterium lividum]
MLVFTGLFILCSLYVCVQVRFILRRRRLSRTTIQELLGRIQPVNLDSISEIAINFLNPSRRQLDLEPPAMWVGVGEMPGLGALIENSAAILDLAAFASRWNNVEGRVVAEMVRRDGVRLRRAVWKIQLATYFGLGRVFAPFQLQEAVSAYYLMRCRLLGLYQVAHIGMYPRLAEVL